MNITIHPIKINKQMFQITLGDKRFLNLFGHIVCRSCGMHQSIPFKEGDYLELEEFHTDTCEQK